MSRYHLSFMEHNDIEQAARVLSIAMLDNPLHIAVLLGNGEKQRRIIEDMFIDMFNTLPGSVFLAKEKTSIVGVMRMKSCVGSGIDYPERAGDESDLEWRRSVWFAEWAKRDPVEQHWHLGPIGVVPTHQGSGIGSMLMERFCEEVDGCGAQAFLETDSDRNVRFYEKFGFQVVAESKIFGVSSLYMSRNAHT